ncbi:MAG: helix-turn-helix domain-containing protein [Fimbriimonadaceae bacterium]|nr:helix-turn-helix domain-containing protein [Fimbriimonadaceae bacterium]
MSEPRWHLWEGGFLLVGRAQGVVPAHAHHAIQIVVALDGRVAIRGEDNRWRQGSGVIVQPNVIHSFDCSGAMGAMLFVDPESSEGRWLRQALDEEIAIVPEVRLASCIAELRATIERPFEGLEIGEAIRRCVHALSPGAPPSRKPDQRISTVLGTIRERDDLRLSLEEAAQLAFLSPSRFAHLFKEQIGLPYSRYMLWRKLTRAMVAIASERTISAAAHAADFADAAHMTRTFHQMVGMAPSILMRGKFAEIPSPFVESSDGDEQRGRSVATKQPPC